MKKRRGYKLSYDLCKKVALSYNTKVDLQKGDGSVYQKIRTSKWDELFSHMISVQKPTGYWTYDRCKEEALKYTNRVSLQKGNGTVYNVIRSNEWSDELFSHMISVQKPTGYWTKERCQKEALKYTRRVDFQKGSVSAQNAAARAGWMDEICQHMGKSHAEKQYTKEEILESARKYSNQRDWYNTEPSVFRCASGYNKKCTSDDDKKFWLSCIEHMEYIFKPNGYWTYERCKEIALKFKTIKDFRESVKHRSVYPIINKNGWYDLLEHLDTSMRPKGYWTYETCKEAALKYKTRGELTKSEDCTAYTMISKNKWFELLSHMKRQMTLKQRVIYVFEFVNSRVAYIGLTCDVDRRMGAHLGKERRYGEVTSPVYKFMNSTGETPKFKILSSKPIKEENAPKSESYYIEKYKNSGWDLLNKARAGSLGGSRRVWTKEKIKSICDSCTKMSEVKEKMPLWAFHSLKRKNEWWDELTSHLIMDVRKDWTDEDALKIAYQYDSITLLSKKYNGVAKYVRTRPKLRKELDIYWKNRAEERRIGKLPTKEDCVKTALKYNRRTEFRKHDYKIFTYVDKNGWLDEICEHMNKSKDRKLSIWTYDRCKEEALKYQDRESLKKHSRLCYDKIYISHWNREMFKHMDLYKKQNAIYRGKYTKEMLVELSKTCKYKSEFQDKYSGAYKAAKKLNLLKELFK